MSKIKDIQLEQEKTDEAVVQTVEEFLEINTANREGFYTHIIQPNENAINIIESMRTILMIDKPEDYFGVDIVKQAKKQMLDAIKSLKLKEE